MNKKMNILQIVLHNIIKFFVLLIFSVVFRPKYLYEDKTVQKRKLRGGLILVSNHNAWDDSLIILNAFFKRQIRFLVKKELAGKKGRIAPLTRIFGMIFIDRHTLDFDAINASLALLKKHKVLTVFPEGTRVKGIEMGGFKAGAVLLAMKAQVPLLPLHIRPFEKWYKRRIIVIGTEITTHLDQKFTVNQKNIEILTAQMTLKINELRDLSMHYELTPK